MPLSYSTSFATYFVFPLDNPSFQRWTGEWLKCVYEQKSIDYFQHQFDLYSDSVNDEIYPGSHTFSEAIALLDSALRALVKGHYAPCLELATNSMFAVTTSEAWRQWGSRFPEDWTLLHDMHINPDAFSLENRYEFAQRTTEAKREAVQKVWLLFYAEIKRFMEERDYTQSP